MGLVCMHICAPLADGESVGCLFGLCTWIILFVVALAYFIWSIVLSAIYEDIIPATGKAYSVTEMESLCSNITSATSHYPAALPTQAPTAMPTHLPTAFPTHAPSLPTQAPTAMPSAHLLREANGLASDNGALPDLAIVSIVLSAVIVVLVVVSTVVVFLTCCYWRRKNKATKLANGLAETAAQEAHDELFEENTALKDEVKQ